MIGPRVGALSFFMFGTVLQPCQAFVAGPGASGYVAQPARPLCMFYAAEPTRRSLGPLAARNLFELINDEDAEGVRGYVAEGGSLNVADTLGVPALLAAAATGSVGVVEAITAAEEVDVNVESFHGGETPLMVACCQGHLSVVKFLVERAGADLNAVNNRYDTALNLACFWRKADIVEYLLDRGANTEIANIENKRPGEDMEDLFVAETEEDTAAEKRIARLLHEKRVEMGVVRSPL